MTQPHDIAPMLATLGELPPDGTQWAYEMKWDGVRAVVQLQDGAARLVSRNGKDMTVSYPELAGLGQAAGRQPIVLDGEIVALDAQHRPSFSRLQNRMHVASAAAARSASIQFPAVLLAFDVLYADGASVMDQPYTARRELLESLQLDGPAWQVPPAFHGDGTHAFAASKQQHLEGVVAKRLVSTYRPGARSRDWIKIKNIRTQEVVIGGWKPGQGRRAGTLGSLLLGVPGERGLTYVGHVGTGFTDRMLAELQKMLDARARSTSPFDTELPRADSRDARWVRADLVGEVAFSEWTPDDRLRHPAWRGLRSDKTADQVVRES